MQVRVIIQSRLSSSRLPAKALLPIQGIPTVVLCARRAANLGHAVMVATSDEPEDNALAATLMSYDIPMMRGPLNDVVARYIMATTDLSENDIIVRLTADNLFPDGQLLAEVVDHFKQHHLDFLTTTFAEGFAPYGLSVEVFTAGTLRKMAATSLSEIDKDHVTAWMIKNLENKQFYTPKASLAKDYHHLRCTLDTFDDYLLLQEIFKNYQDPIAASWVDLVGLLAKQYNDLDGMPAKTVQGVRHSRLTLGSAQLGLAYGKTNKVGLPDEKQALAIIKQSLKLGVTSVDTAHAYGLAEQRIGVALAKGLSTQVTIITKLDTLSCLDEQATLPVIHAAVDASIYRSCYRLGLEKLPVVLLHRWQHYYEYKGAIWQRLLALQKQGIIMHLGASVYSPIDAIEALQDPDIKYIQIPFNILDWRWLDKTFLDAVKKRPEVIIHARSALLQGILAATEKDWPRVPNVNAAEILSTLDNFVKIFNRKNRADLCYAYVRSFPFITSVVVGIETLSQLYDNVVLFQQPELQRQEIEAIQSSFSQMQVALLNPAEWSS